MKRSASQVRRAGAKKVFLASASPPVRYVNVYGVDMPTRREFVACDLTEEEIRSVLGADGLLYQSLEDLLGVGQELNPSIKHFEDSCFSGALLPPAKDVLDSLMVAERSGQARGGDERTLNEYSPRNPH